MAINLLDSGSIVGLTASPILTNSVAPTDDALVLIHFTQYRAASSPASPPNTISGAGLTFDLVDSNNYDNAGSTRGGQSLYRAQGNASSGQISLLSSYIDAAGIITWQVFEITDVLIGNNGADAIEQFVGDAAGETDDTLAVTLASFAEPTNVTLGLAAIRETDVSVTAGSGFTLLDTVNPGTDRTRGLVEYKAGADTTPDFTVGAGAGALGRRMLGVEINLLPQPQTATGNPSVVNVRGRRGDPYVDPIDANYRRPRRAHVWIHGYDGGRENVLT